MPALVIPLGVLLIACVALGLAFKQAEEQLAAQQDDDGGIWQTITGGLVGLFGVVGIFSTQATRAVHAILSRLAAAKMPALTRYFDSQAQLASRASRTVADFAGTVADGFDRLITVTMPHAIYAAVRPVGLTARQALRLARSGRLLARRALHAAAVARAAADHALDWSRRRTGELARDIAGVRGRVRSLDDWLAKNRDAVRKLRKLLTVAGFTALLIRALARKFPWLFCRKVNTIGKRACGLDPDFLQSLLGTSLLIAGSISLAEMARDLRGPTQLVEEGLATLIRELN